MSRQKKIVKNEQKLNYTKNDLNKLKKADLINIIHDVSTIKLPNKHTKVILIDLSIW
jgi:hypothetical protein